MPIEPVVANSAKHLAKSIQAVASQLLADLAAGNDMVEALLLTDCEMERLSIEASLASEQALSIELGRLGSG